ncbi:restriction endonuclease subunit S [Aquipseudomonas alcaligenes]|uniref:Site-specific DNA recognition subunit n=1 Tax=Aquipseudomonas alcaligenes TaxID=43263 RepID=A0A9X9ZA47_AQUAC|nr:restriction endonuclease subunit S [Pseudomonas alcaligenes]7VS4_C Chain C, Site-specific DNA recognition subunit [Pseudomonas alcaligenes]
MTAQQLPEGWQMVKFGDIAKHISKRVEPSETDLDIYVGLEHLDPDSLKIKRYGVPSDVAGQKLLVKKGQIIFGKRRAYQRKVAVADWDCICSAHAMVLEPLSDKVIPEFLPFFMQSDSFMNRAVAISEGSLSPTIKWKTLSSQSFLMPSLTTQATLIKILSKISEVESSLESAKLSLQLLSSAFIDELLNHDKNWTIVRAGEACSLITKGASPRWQGFEYAADGSLFVTSENIQHWAVDISSPKYIPDEFSEKNLRRSQLRAGDVLVNIVGASIGRCALWDGSHEKANINQAVALLRPKPELDSRWLLAQLYSKRGQEYFGLSAVDNARPNLSLKSLSDFEFYLPPIEIQKKTMDIFELFSSKVISNKKLTLKAIKSSLVNNS